MRSVEVEGRTVDGAIGRALGASRDRVRIGILKIGTRGMLGVGARPARVRGTIRPRIDVWTPVREFPVAVSPIAAIEEMTPASFGSAAPDSDQATAAAAIIIVRGILVRMGMDDLTVVDPGGDDGFLLLTLVGGSAAELVAGRGEILLALEHVVDRALERRGASRGRVVLGAAGYRVRRTASLVELAGHAAEQARRRGRPVAAKVLTASDHRILRDVLAPASDLELRTVGPVGQRRVIVVTVDMRRGTSKKPPR